MSVSAVAIIRKPRNNRSTPYWMRVNYSKCFTEHTRCFWTNSRFYYFLLRLQKNGISLCSEIETVTFFTILLILLNYKAAVNTIVSKTRNCMTIDPFSANQNRNRRWASYCGNCQYTSQTLLHWKQLRAGKHSFSK